MFRHNAQHTGDYILVAGGNASNGRLNWNYTTGGIVESSPAIDFGMVYVGSHDHNIYALNAGDRGESVELQDWRPCDLFPYYR